MPLIMEYYVSFDFDIIFDRKSTWYNLLLDIFLINMCLWIFVGTKLYKILMNIFVTAIA
jgi:hypothetical protein